jgi:energy-coupling factor transporter transmembrane protein EcfT
MSASGGLAVAADAGAPRAAWDRAGSVAAVLLGALVGAMVAGRIATAMTCAAAALVAGLFVRAPRPRRRWLLTLASSMAVAVALNLYLVPGRALPGPVLFGRAPSDAGLRDGALFALRILGAMIALRGLAAAWPGERAADEIARGLRPLERLRVPVREARVMIGLALRFTPLLRDEARRIAALQDLRAGRPPRGAREWWRRRRAVMVPVMVSALERADRVALALEARHYRLRPLPAAGRAHPGAVLGGAALAGVALLWRG